MISRNLRSGALLFTAIICLSFLVKYSFLLSEKENDAEENAEKIYAILSDNFDQTEKILNSVGRKIVENSPNLEPKAIHKIFVETPNINGYNNIFSWSLFDWVDIDGFQTVNSMLGIRKNPPQIGLERNYLNHGTESWKITFSNGVFGNTSEIYVIPAGVRIESKSHQRLGAVAVGIDVKKLTTVIESRLDKDISFLLIDQRSNQVTCGPRDSDKHFGKIFNRMPESLDGKNYVYEKRMDPKYPYKIWVGYDKKEFWREVYYSSLLLAIQIIGVGACASFLIRNSEE